MMTRERDVALLRAQPADEGNIPDRPSPTGTLIVVVALVVALLYFGVTRTTTPPTQPQAPTLAMPQTE